MKLLHTALILLASLVSLVAWGAPVKNGIALSDQAIEISGTNPMGAAVDALLYYIPDTKLNPDPGVCNFPEDEYKPNGPNKVVGIDAENSDGRYLIRLPLTGQKDSCHYILSGIYLDVKKDSVFESISINSEETIRERDAWNPEAEMAPSFAGLNSLYCEFSEKEVGLCEVDHQLLSPEYSIQIREQKIRFDIQDIP